MSCCDSILKIGCFNSCETIETGLTATQTGTATVRVNNSDLIDFSITSGAEMEIPCGYLSEDGTTVFKIIQPNGTEFTSGDYDCFKVEITPAYTGGSACEQSTTDCGTTTNKIITSADFTAGVITGQSIPGLLTGKTADIDFFLYSNEGSGALLKVNDGYTFNSVNGQITTTAGNYRLQVFL